MLPPNVPVSARHVLARVWLPTLVVSGAAVLLGAVLARAQLATPPGELATFGRLEAKNARPALDRAEDCLREGTRIVGTHGHFRMTGDRVTFFAADGKGRFVGLENLNLERIARAIAEEDPTRLEWNVTGTITEYRGANFLTVECAILTRANKPRDEHSPQ